MTTTFYAELLPNIRSISVSIALPTPSTSSTHAVIIAGASSIILHHNESTTSLVLPARANPGSQEIIISPKLGEEIFSCRLPIIDSATSLSENLTPWSAISLSSTPTGSFHCQNCDICLIGAGTITSWKDLPSSNWADMMDFWHCHKPSEKPSTTSPNVIPKYTSVGHDIILDSGTGLVEGGYFLFSRKDCENGIQTTAFNNGSAKLCCKSCGAILGSPETKHKDHKQDGMYLWRINKWNLRYYNSGSRAAYPLESFLASQFLTYVENEGVRRLLIANREDKSMNKLKLWIFNTDIYYTHSYTPQPVRGVKVYWNLLNIGEEPPRTDRVTSTGFEAVDLDDEIFQALMNCLTTSGQAMPEDLRTIGDWNAGALNRFEKANS